LFRRREGEGVREGNEKERTEGGRERGREGGREGRTYLADDPVEADRGNVAVVELGEPAEVGEPPPDPMILIPWGGRGGGREGGIGG
jgi:hypothetical protein